MKDYAAPQKYFTPKRQYLRVMADGREVLDLTHPKGRAEYELRKREMWERQAHVCCMCERPLYFEESQFEHERGRGMGGALRDDRIEVDGQWRNGLSCMRCNLAKGSVRGTYNAARNSGLLGVL